MGERTGGRQRERERWGGGGGGGGGGAERPGDFKDEPAYASISKITSNQESASIGRISQQV